MNITSRLTSYSWLRLDVEEDNTKILTAIDSVKEAERLKDELLEVINDLDTYIEKQTKS